MLGIDRATVIRATEALHELGFIEKVSHGGKTHRAAYLPNWDRFRAIVEDWDARMRTGDAPNTPCRSTGTPADTPAPNVATLRRSRSQGCDVKGRKVATQTLRSNPSKKPVEGERMETQAEKPRQQSPPQARKGLWNGNGQDAQRSMLLPITGGKSPSHEEAARAAAERRWYANVHALGMQAEAEVLEWTTRDRQEATTRDRQEATTRAEMQRRGGGLAFILDGIHGGRMQAHG